MMDRYNNGKTSWRKTVLVYVIIKKLTPSFVLRKDNLKTTFKFQFATQNFSTLHDHPSQGIKVN